VEFSRWYAILRYLAGGYVDGLATRQSEYTLFSLHSPESVC
jgi:hypothetical protein